MSVNLLKTSTRVYFTIPIITRPVSVPASMSGIVNLYSALRFVLVFCVDGASKHACLYQGSPNGGSIQTLPPLCLIKKTSSPHLVAMSTEASTVTTDVVARIISGSSATASDTTAVQMQRDTSPLDVAKFNRVSTSATRRHLISPQLT